MRLIDADALASALNNGRLEEQTDNWRWHLMDKPQYTRHILSTWIMGTKVLAWMPLPEPYKGERKDDEIDRR